MLKLNVGCGNNKIKGYINIDTEESVHPDLIHNILEAPLPYEDSSVDEIVFFHCIEHVRKVFHEQILTEFYRVLKLGSSLYISYPNFWECAQRWHNNKDGIRGFWEATLYGRQLYPADFHVCAMNPDELCELLDKIGFGSIKSAPEPHETYNTITHAVKKENTMIDYEKLIAEDPLKVTINTIR